MVGATVQWLRDNLKLIETAAETEALAQSVDDSGGCLVPAFSGLFAPYWRSDARGVIVGLTRYINRNHIVRCPRIHLLPDARCWTRRKPTAAYLCAASR